MSKPSRITLRAANSSDARRLHSLIAANVEEGHLLPRTLSELEVHAHRFVVAVRGRTIVGCVELAPLGTRLAEVRSLSIDRSARSNGAGTMLVEEIRRQAARDGYEKLCAFTATPGYFIRMGFSIVPHLWLHEKIFTDCVGCSLFRHCGKYAMEVSLDSVRDHSADDVREPVHDGQLTALVAAHPA